MTAGRHCQVQCFAFALPLKATFAVLPVAASPDSTNCPFSSDTLRNTHPNSAGLCRPSAPKHCLLVDAQERVNSLTVLAKAQVNHGRANSCQIACFRRGVLWFCAGGVEGLSFFSFFFLLLLAPNSGHSGVSWSSTHNDCSLSLCVCVSALPPLCAPRGAVAASQLC